MLYGRTVLEVVVAQALILTAFIVFPVDLLASLGSAGGGLLASAIAGVVGTALYLRHRGRVAAVFSNKLETLRHSPAA
jgi:hypothetical protein